MPARIEVKIALPPSHPKRLLFRASRPPPDSTIEMLGNRRQSRLFWSAARRQSSEKSCAGHAPFWKNLFRLSSRGSFRYSDAASGVSATVTATGLESILAKTKPLDRIFFIDST